jgi:hypothetical protein
MAAAETDHERRQLYADLAAFCELTGVKAVAL